VSTDYVRHYYKVPARLGGRVIWRGKAGMIISADHRIYVKFDDRDHSVPLHPRDDDLVYLDSDNPANAKEAE
jgi:hypothetical protein